MGLLAREAGEGKSMDMSGHTQVTSSIIENRCWSLKKPQLVTIVRQYDCPPYGREMAVDYAFRFYECVMKKREKKAGEPREKSAPCQGRGQGPPVFPAYEFFFHIGAAAPSLFFLPSHTRRTSP